MSARVSIPPSTKHLETYVDKLDACHGIRCICITLLHPIDHPQKNVILCIECCVGSAEGGLANLPCAYTTRAVAHAAYAEETVEAIELAGGQAHGVDDMVVVARRVLRGDDGIGLK